MEQQTVSTPKTAADLEPPQPNGDFGILDTWAQLAIGYGETVAKAGFGFVQTVRSEVTQRVREGLDWGENLQRGGFRIMREVTARTDHVMGDALSRGEFAVLSVLGALRRTSHSVAGVTSKTIGEAVGNGSSSGRISRSAA